jgi:thiosulfate/3-mercaptopyruvate sulfurtransferase
MSAFEEPLVTTDWLHDNLGQPDLSIVDCTVVMRPTEDGGYTFVGGEDEWRAGHIPSSTFVDVLRELADDTSSLPMMLPAPERFAAVMERLGVGDGTRTVLYDRSNHAWAARVWWMLRVHGYDSAAVLDGGWNKWLAEGRAVSSEEPDYDLCRFSVQLRSEMVATRDDVLNAISDSGQLLINALSPEEHAGRSTRFARPGRISGSVNVYCQSLVDADSFTYHSKDRLEQMFSAVGAQPDQPAITYCGAGIAASSDALALHLLGYRNVTVYDGSLSGWTADPDLPMETG